MANIQDLLTETAAEPPCGPDLTYDNDFQSMESAAQGKVEQQFGDTVIPAEPPDWRDVERQASALMQRTKDLRVAVLLCRAWTILHGLPGTLQGLQLCAALLERHWEHVHPLPEDGDDYFMRMNALGTLSDVTGFVRDLRNADFLRGALGQISVRDAELMAKGNVPEDLPHLTADELRMASARAHAEGHETLLAVTPALQELDRICACCEQHLPSHQQPELDGLRQLLLALKQWQPQSTGDADTAAETEPAAQVGTGDGLAAQPAPGTPHTPARSREQAIAQLLEIAAFVERTEPSNPAPLLIRRAARFMRMGFMDILRELSPDSLAQVEVITGAHLQDNQA
ncbi:MULTISPECIES: type VI secretion system protein TssA [unclassified Delftia]|uniref:type VI secretion system protein TssA n=1 Tax=unclassified Delftia TaxID=2613839 RepID=UPI0006477CC0|nr:MULTISPECIES: type VI secretion system protein TssA [unclassified Delftia]MDC2862290.1 type VI secretion system protein TssA [Delftia sp. DT-2]